MRGKTHSEVQDLSQRQLNTMIYTALGISLPGVFFTLSWGERKCVMGKIIAIHNKAGKVPTGLPAKTVKTVPKAEPEVRTPKGLVIPKSVLKRERKKSCTKVNTTAVNLREVHTPVASDVKQADKIAIKPKADGELSRVAAYCRVSTLQEEQDLSYETQCEYYEKLIENDPGRQLVGVYGDHGVSGLSAAKRKGFMDMIEACRRGEVDEIFTRSISRFARNFAECVEYARELKQMGITIHFEKEGFTNTDENSEMLFTLMAMVAQEESNSNSQAHLWTNEHRNSVGDPVRGKVYGYTRDSKKTDGIHLWHIKEDEAERVRMVYSLYLEDLKFSAIAEKMKEYEEKNGATRKNWTPSGIQYILTNEVYAGDIHTNKTYTPDYLSGKAKKNDGEVPRYYLKDHHPAIISREAFDRVQDLIAQRKKVRRKSQ